MTESSFAPAVREDILASFLPDQIDAHHFLVQVGAADRSTMTFGCNEKIYSEGEPAEMVFFVQHGSIELVQDSRRGDIVVLGTASDGEFFGATCLYDVSFRIATATALTESRITAVTKSSVFAAVRKHPRFAKMFIERLWHNGPTQKDLLSRLLKMSTER
jgi:CRP/FNR family cyclic AMP-dependent transcriptional regulator